MLRNIKPKSDDYKGCLEAFKKYHGLPPYNDGTNVVKGDGWFLRSIHEIYTKKTVEKASKQAQKLLDKMTAIFY